MARAHQSAVAAVTDGETAVLPGKRSYSDDERLSVMLVALRAGVPAAVAQSGVPERTIYQWFQNMGGLAEIRGLANAAAEQALSLAGQAVCEEVSRRVQDLSDADLLGAFRSVAAARPATTGLRGDDTFVGPVLVVGPRNPPPALEPPSN